MLLHQKNQNFSFFSRKQDKVKDLSISCTIRYFFLITPMWLNSIQRNDSIVLSFFKLLHTPQTWKSSRVCIFRLDVVHERFVELLICLWYVSVCRRVKYGPFCWTQQQYCFNGIHCLCTHIFECRKCIMEGKQFTGY